MTYLEIFLRVLSLIGIAMLGFAAGRLLSTRPKDISILLIYFISPAVIFLAVLEAPAGTLYFVFTVGAFGACCIMATLALAIGRRLWQDNTANLFGFTGGAANVGYFGLPMATGLYGDLGAAIAAFIIMGVILYEFTYGYFVTSRGHYTFRESLIRISRLPITYAFVLALILRRFDWSSNDIIFSVLRNFKGAYSILGMMIIGITLSQFRGVRIDRRFLVATLSWKFVAWPLLGLGILTVSGDRLTAAEQGVIMLMASVPMAGNTVVIANELDVHPNKAATAVMLSTVLALISVPLFLSLV